jgi:hypothetical protein
MTTEAKKKWKYTKDFRRDAVVLVTGQGYKRWQAQDFWSTHPVRVLVG